MKPLILTTDPGRTPTHSLIFLHGFGASAEGLRGIVNKLSAGQGHTLRIVLPQAPVQPMTIFGGRPLAGWYDMRDTHDLDKRIDTEGIAASVAKVNRLIIAERAAGRENNEIFVGGFSQGGVIAYHCGLSAPERLGGLVCLSTYFPGSVTLKPQPHLAGLPVFAAHGTQDNAGPYWMGELGAKEASRLGADLRWRSYPMGHTMADPELNDVNTFLADLTHSGPPHPA
jgi:phospholipase/carboxylesterase